MRVVTHTDFDGICCAALFIRKFGSDIEIIYASVDEAKELNFSNIQVDYTCDLPKIGTSINLDHHQSNYDNLINAKLISEEDWVDPQESSATDIVFKYLKLDNDVISTEIRKLGHLADIAELPEEYKPLDIVLNMNNDNKTILREMSDLLSNLGRMILSTEWLKNKHEEVLTTFNRTKEEINKFLENNFEFPRILLLDTRLKIPGKLAKEIIKPIFERNVAVLGIIYVKGSKINIRLSFRVRKDQQEYYDVSQIAKSFGGGGHKMAAACTPQPIDIPDNILNALKNIARANESVGFIQV